MTNNELYHFGIKGMKWGVRRKSDTTTSSNPMKKLRSKPSEEEMHDDYKKVHDTKHVSTLSDAELRARINRIQLEQQYYRLNPSNVDKGRATVENTLKLIATAATVTGTVVTLRNNTNALREGFKKVKQVRQAVEQVAK